MMTRAVPAVLLALAVLLSGAAAVLAIRVTRAPGKTDYDPARRRRCLLPFLAGATVVAGALFMIVRAGLATRTLGADAATPSLVVALAALGAGTSAALLMALNALAHPRGLSPGWLLVLAAPFLYAQAIVPFVTVSPAAVGTGWPGDLVAAISGGAAGTITFLAALVIMGRTDLRQRIAAAAIAAAATLQALAAAALVDGGATWPLLVAGGDALSGLALLLVLLWGTGASARASHTPTVTLRPTG